MDKLTPEKIEQLRGLLAKATPGPWEADEEKNEGCYGVGDDCHEGFQSASIHAPDGRGGSAKLFDALNSDAACVEEEYDEDRHYAWDGVSRINAALIVAMRNALPALLASLASKDAEIERLKADLAKEEGAHSITVDQRDAAENCIGDVYFEITGRAPEWSNQFGYDDAFDEISARAEAAESRLTTALAALGEAGGIMQLARVDLDASRIIIEGAMTNTGEIAHGLRQTIDKIDATLAKLNALEGNEDD